MEKCMQLLILFVMQLNVIYIVTELFVFDDRTTPTVNALRITVLFDLH